eukprot:389035-Amorphochlora_amoeboformis.AAC.1
MKQKDKTMGWNIYAHREGKKSVFILSPLPNDLSSSAVTKTVTQPLLSHFSICFSFLYSHLPVALSR